MNNFKENQELVIIKYSDGSEQAVTKKSWINKENKVKIYELMKRVEPDIREGNKPVWEEIQKLVFEEREMAKPKTYFLTGTILEKLRERVRRRESVIDGKTYEVKSFGTFFYRFKMGITIGGEGQTSIEQVWCFKDVLDNPEEDWPKVEAIATGERYEFEVEKPKSTNYRLRSLRRL